MFSEQRGSLRYAAIAVTKDDRPTGEGMPAEHGVDNFLPEANVRQARPLQELPRIGDHGEGGAELRGQFEDLLGRVLRRPFGDEGAKDSVRVG